MHHKFVTHNQRKLPCYSLVALIGLLCLLTGCLNPHKLLDRYQEVSVRGLNSTTGYIAVEVRVCEPGKKKPFLLERHRRVDVPLGNELFFLPEIPAGKLQVLVKAYQSSAMEKLVKLKDWYTETYKRREPLPILTLEKANSQQMLAPLSCTTSAPVIEPPPKRPSPTNWTLKVPITRSATLPNSPLRALDPTRIIPPIQTQPTLPGSPFRLRDKLTLRPPISFPEVTGRLLTKAGRKLLVAGGSDKSEDATISVLNLHSGEREHSIELPMGCRPSDIDAQGSTVVVACGGKDKVYLFSAKSWERLEPKTGIVVGSNPVAVKISGRFVLVVNQGSNNVSVFRLDRPNDKPQTIEVGETPTDVTAVGSRFYVANSDSGSVSMIDVDPSRSEARKWDSDLTVGRKPTHLAANGKFLVVGNRLDQTLTIQPLGTGLKPRTIQLGGNPGDIVLLSHTAIVADSSNERMIVLDLRTFTVSQLLPLNEKVHSLLLTGETLFATSNSGKTLLSALFDSRTGQQKFRVAASPRQLLTYNNELWIYDGLSQRVAVMNPQYGLLTSHIQLARSSVENSIWKHTTGDLLLHTSADNPNEIQVRSLRSPLHILLNLKFDQPAVATRTIGDTAYFLHQVTDGSTHSPFITKVNLKEARQSIRVQSPELHLNFVKKPVDFLKSGNHWFVADKQARALVITKSTGSNDDEHFHFLRSLPLKGTPRQLKVLGSTLVVLLENGVIQLLDTSKNTNELALQSPIQLGEQLGQVKIYKDTFVFTDRKQDILIFFSPSKDKIVEKIKTGCNPDHVVFWNNKAVVSNRDDGSLSFLPLSF